ncbi:MAG: hypothetical protein K2X38_09610 [Gemmataceae bacterium]|nr:hypothetical protein [Gemmataceae bacterium]
MFLVKDRRLGMDHFIFTQMDPREDGYRGDVIENVSLDYDMNAVHRWPEGLGRPDPQLGRSPGDPSHYKVFKSHNELSESGFKYVHFNTPFVAYSWEDYRKRYYPIPEEFAKRMTEEEWFDFLDDADAAQKVRQTMSEPKKPTKTSDRDEIAQWIAKRHFNVDAAVRQIWFLPAESPPDEFRFLEVNDRFASESQHVEPIDMGFDVDGSSFRLLVADVSGTQLEQIKSKPATLLPSGWSLRNAIVWGRRGRQG